MLNKNMNVVKKLTMQSVGIAFGLSALVATPVVLAASGGTATPQHYQLSYKGSDLKSMQSVKALHKRIRRIAVSYCPDYGVTKDLSERASCIEDVEADLVSQVGHPLLTKVHRGDVAMTIAGTDR